MKKMKKFLSLSVAAVLALSMTACGSKAGDTQNADATEKSSSNATEKSSSNAKYTVGICQLVQHEALDAATKGFKDYLTEKLGDDVVFDEQMFAQVFAQKRLKKQPTLLWLREEIGKELEQVRHATCGYIRLPAENNRDPW